ncbi:glycosyltransferase family 25 protein [Sphingobacterium griseoflavum]|uniref:Uncharacterized protein n=1 Tax=Sphingobacterium griseoflavum TaxID=1474952 RepID=A0ABQ3HZY7_9SPHI|nr:hypothetical protein [Sphingobacterium griseoflavum]GHE44112.1 hypothetical protein GCM10017764_29340 [Sphingobacterium griseoflavum]
MYSNKIPTYIINLEKRKDRKVYVKEQFLSRPEFNIKFFNAIEDTIPAIGLYKSLYTIINQAHEQKLPFVLICEDDHQFTNFYNKDVFINYLKRLRKYNADAFLGGVSWFDYGVHIEDDLYWVNNFTGTQFLIIYSSFFERILDSPFEQDDITDKWMCNLSDKIFVSVPMLSIQRDFGYSDVTPKNNAPAIVSRLFEITNERWQSIKNVITHIQRSKQIFDKIAVDTDIQLPTYIINLPHRSDRLLHIQQQFAGRTEFDVTIVKAIKDSNGAMGLWKSIQKVVQLAVERDDEVILICEDDHVFCDGYQSKILFDAIIQGSFLGADLILGGISSTEQVIPANDHLCWISSFQCTQFTIVYNRFFDQMLTADFNETDAADLKFSSMTANKYVFHPFISVQKDFGYSDIPIDNFGTDKYIDKFNNCSAKIEKVKYISGIAESRQNRTKNN